MKKRLLSALLALSVLAASLPVYAQEETVPSAPAAASVATTETAAEDTEPTATPATETPEPEQSPVPSVSPTPEQTPVAAPTVTPTPTPSATATPVPEAAPQAPARVPAAPQQAPADEADKAEAEEAQPEETTEYMEVEVPAEDLGADLPDNDELFALYLQQQMYPDRVPSLLSNWGEAEGTLNEQELAIYNTLKTFVEKVARGEGVDAGSNEISTQEIPVPGELSWTFEELGVSDPNDSEFGNKVATALGKEIGFSKIARCLIVDCPAELYWFDKTVGYSWGFSITTRGTTVTVSELNMKFAVAQEYQGSGAYSVDATKTGAVSAALAKAKAIADQYANSSDYDKLVAFKNEICNLTSYNDEAAADSDTPYGNPWQLIYVFDGDPSTTVVCEGYAKAFQYLCDLSGLTCYTVTGTMDGGTGAGAHMWNIVTLDGKNYLVDVTNCDDSTIGYPDELFLAGTAGSVEGGYTFAIGNSNVTYKYDWIETIGLYPASILTLSGSRYTPALTITGMPETVTYGDTFTLTAANAGDAVTWKASGTAMVDASGTVTVIGVGKFTITATAGDQVQTVSGQAMPRALTIPTAVVHNKDYDGTTEVPVSGITLSNVVSGDSVFINLNAVTATVSSANAGTYDTVSLSNLQLTGADAGMYTIASPCVVAEAVTISKVPSTLTQAPQAVTGLTYTGQPQELVTAGTATGGTLQYALSEDGSGTYSEELPTGTDAGTYTVWYKVVGDANHTDTEAVKLGDVTIAKATPITPDGLSSSFGHKLSDIDLPDGWVWDDPDTTLTRLGDQTFPAHHPGNNNYMEEGTTELKVSVSDAALKDWDVEWGENLTYNGETQMMTVKRVYLTYNPSFELIEGDHYRIDTDLARDVGIYTIKVLGLKGLYGTQISDFIVSPKPLEAQVTVAEKTYDGTDTAEVSATVETGVEGETLTITGLQGHFAQKDAGENLTVTVDSSAAQWNNKNYEVTFPGTATASITPADYSYAGVADQEVRIGNGLDTINASGTAAGVANELVDGTLTWYEDENHTTALSDDYRFAGEAGDTVTLYWVFTPAADETNYTTQPVAGSTEFTLTEKLVPQLDVQGLTKVYDGQAVTLDNLPHKADVAGSWSLAEGTPELKDAGEYDVEVCFTPDDGRTYAPTSTVVKVRIEKRSIVVELQLSATQIMPADAVPTASLVYHGVVEGESVEPSLQPVITGLPEQAEPGIYAVELSNRDEMQKAIEATEAGKNYTVSFIDTVVLTVGDIVFANDVQDGIPEIPQSLQEIGLTDEDAVLDKMLQTAIEKVPETTKESTVLYDVTLRYSEDGGKTWQDATAEHFPEEGITVTLPYPTGTNAQNFTFVVTHMITVAHNGYQPGDVETPAVTKTNEGIQFTVYSLSPIAVSWTSTEPAPAEPEPEEPIKPAEPKPEEPVKQEETSKPAEEPVAEQSSEQESGSAAVSTPAPTATPAPRDNISYYTCPDCGYHNWTATDAGYRCDHCGYLETVKQLSGYGNVKGVYTPKSGSGASAAPAAASAIAATGDDSNPALWGVVMLVSALALGGLVVYRRKRKY